MDVECPVCGGLGYLEFEEEEEIMFEECYYCEGKKRVTYKCEE